MFVHFHIITKKKQKKNATNKLKYALGQRGAFKTEEAIRGVLY